MREPRCLRHRNVHHDEQFERRKRLAHALAVGDRIRRIAALDQHRTITKRVIGEDFFGNDITRNEPGNDPCAHNGALLLGRRLTACRARALRATGRALTERRDRNERREGIGRSFTTEVSGERQDQSLKVAAERRVHRHLHAEIFEYGDARIRCDAPRDSVQTLFVDTADAGIARDRDVGKRGFDKFHAARALHNP